MDTTRSELTKALVRAGLRGVRLAPGRANGVANAANSGEEDRGLRHSPTAGEEGGPQPIYETGKGPGLLNPGQGVGVSRNVNPEIEPEKDLSFRTNYGPHMGTAMAAAMSNGMQWRVVRAMPLLMIASTGAHD